MLEDKTEQNISRLYALIIPIIAVAKFVRWQLMFNQLIALSIGWRMVYEMNDKTYEPFHAGVLSETANKASVIVSNCEAFYDAINIFGINTFEGWEVFLTIVFNVIMVAIVVAWYKKNPYAGWRENVFIYMNIGLVNLYCCNISKECWQIVFYFLMAFVMLRIKGYRRKNIAMLLVVFLSVLYARKYFALIAMYFLVLQFVVRRYFYNVDVVTGAGRRQILYRVLGLFALFGIFHYFFLGYMASENEDTYNEMVLANTRESQISESVISPIFTGNQVALALDYFVKIFRLSFPVELLLKGKVTYIFMILNQFLLFGFIVRAFVKRNEMTVEEEEELRYENEEYAVQEDVEIIQNADCVEEPDFYEEDADMEEVYDDVVLETQDNKDNRMVALYMYLAFLLCSAAFEPDFGSWSRHLGCAFPFILFVL